MADSKLELLIDIRSRLDELTKASSEMAKFRQEATGAGQALKTGFGVDLARRGLDLLTGTLQASLFESFRLADEIEDNARNLDISTSAYQVLGAAMRDAGGDIGMLQSAVAANNRSLAEARNTTSGAAAAYRQLGLDIRELESMPVERRLEAIGRAMIGATDKTEAFAAAGQVLGTRNLPTLLGALKTLAAEGYDEVAASAARAGKVMSEQTISLLADAKKTIEEFKNVTLPVMTGTAISWAQSAMDRVGSNYANFFNVLQGLPISTFSRAEQPKPAPTPPISVDKTPFDQTPAWQAQRLALTKAINAQAVIESDNTTTEARKRAALVPLLWDEYHARKGMLDLAMKAETTPSFTEDQKAETVEKLRAEVAQNAVKYRNLTSEQSALERREGNPLWMNTENRAANPNFLAPGEGVTAGAGDWVTELGSRGEQVADALQNTLGQTVTGISDGIYGWITGAQSFGDAMAQLGDSIFRTIIQTIVQMGVQWLVTQALIKTSMISTEALVDSLRAARVVKENAAEAATLPAKTAGAAASGISSFGGALLFGALAVALIASLAGGFSSGGYTGDVPRNQIAGVTHGREYVLNADATAAIGRDALDYANRYGRLPAPVGAAAPVRSGGLAVNQTSLGQAFGGSGESGRNIHVYLDHSVWLDAVAQDLRGIAIEEYARQSRA